MTPEEEKNIRFVGKLLEQTMTGVMKWQKLSREYEAEAGGMEFHLFKGDMSSRSRVARAFYTHPTSGGAPEQIVLRVCDPETRVEKTFADMPIVGDLYTIVQKKTASLDTKIDAFLNKDVTHAQ